MLSAKRKKKWANGRMEAVDGFWLAVINSCGDVVGFWAMFSLEVSIVTFVYLSIVVVLF
jgi:hypothetical protein